MLPGDPLTPPKASPAAPGVSNAWALAAQMCGSYPNGTFGKCVALAMQGTVLKPPKYPNHVRQRRPASDQEGGGEGRGGGGGGGSAKHISESKMRAHDEPLSSAGSGTCGCLRYVLFFKCREMFRTSLNAERCEWFPDIWINRG